MELQRRDPGQQSGPRRTGCGVLFSRRPGRSPGMKVLVSGATGFMGRFLCRTMKASGHEVVELGSRNCDLTQADSLNAFTGCRFDQIYHLAAWTQAGEFCLHHPGEQWLINQQINTQMLIWWQRYQPQAKLIAMGTSCA